MTTLGSKLSALRRARGLSQEQLAEAIGVSRQAVSKWELDAAAPEIDKIKSLADFYGVTTDYLLRPDAEAPSAPAPPSDSKRQASPIPSLGVSLTGCAVGLLLQYHGRFISASEWPSLVGALLQIVCFACGLTCFVQLRHTSPTVGGRFLRLFLRLSVWLVLPLPCMAGMRLLFSFYPRPYWSLVPVAAGFVLYLLLCGLVTAWTLRQKAV
ncbi:MAG: helix-turn-helix transcriptional regulator [Butyricicoccus sp.]|nr:helix-turn-helix transcriptional regulator [Butyricicoccus sp.]